MVRSLPASLAFLMTIARPTTSYVQMRSFVRPATPLRPRADVSALVGVEPVLALQALGSAFEHELGAYPLQVNALVTGCTYFIGDAVAQLIQGGQPCAKRAVRAFVVGLLFLGPLSHYWYSWTADQDLQVCAKVLHCLSFIPHPLPCLTPTTAPCNTCQVLLDNTLFLSLDNCAFLGALTLLGGCPSGHGSVAGTAGAAGASESVAGAISELWSMQVLGWKFLPFIALLNYALVPAQHRVIFVDAADVVFAAALSMQRFNPPVGPAVVAPPFSHSPSDLPTL
ncbi:hypothetical protein T492DRAFT_1139509 [Pavlovales sp. CCMP2436]|nr:hypothetical protein T492DRAFT_1139509 [Pavlovales sp. CCMP2436]